MAGPDIPALHNGNACGTTQTCIKAQSLVMLMGSSRKVSQWVVSGGQANDDKHKA